MLVYMHTQLLSLKVLVQGLLLDLGGPGLLTKLTGSGPDQRITQPALYAIGNLAAKNAGAQNALRESGGFPPSCESASLTAPLMLNFTANFQYLKARS